MSDDQAPLHLANLLSRGYTMAEARRRCGMTDTPAQEAPAAAAQEEVAAPDVDDEAPALPFSTKPATPAKKAVAPAKKPVTPAKKPTPGLL